MSDDITAQAMPTGEDIWIWALASAPEIAAAIGRAIAADRPSAVWHEIKAIGDLLMDLFDPQQVAGAGTFKIAAIDVPWDKILTVVLPAIIELIRRRRAERGA